MSDHLRSLLERHRFLDDALATHGKALTTYDLETLRRERDRVLWELMNLVSANPQVTLAQIRLIASSLAGLAAPAMEAERLRDACLSAAERLVAELEEQARKRAIETTAIAQERPIAYIDVLPDRATAVDQSYNMVFVNKASAKYYNKSPGELEGRPIRSVVGKARFEQLSKPNLDACFAGKELAHVAQHNAVGKSWLYAVTYSPVRNAKGVIEQALVVARDVTNLGVKPDVIWPAFDEP